MVGRTKEALAGQQILSLSLLHVLYDHIGAPNRFAAAVVVHLSAAVPPVRGERRELRVQRARGEGLTCRHGAHGIGTLEVDLQEAHPRQARLPLDVAVLVVAVRHAPVLREGGREVRRIDIARAGLVDDLLLARVQWVGVRDNIREMQARPRDVLGRRAVLP